MPRISALLVLAAATAFPQRLRPALQLLSQQARAQRVAQMAPPRHLCRLYAADDEEDDPEILLAKAEFLRQQAKYLSALPLLVVLPPALLLLDVLHALAAELHQLLPDLDEHGGLRGV